MQKYLLASAALAATASLASGQVLINEFQPNPAGGDPATQDIELLGTPGAAFDLFLLSVENDGFNGAVDRSSNVTGTFDSNGLAVVNVPDLENPSNTLILTDSFTGDTSTDLDPADDGVLDLSSLGAVLDSIGVSDAAGDDATLYSTILGGTDILFNGEFEPLFVFRDSVTGDYFQGVTVDFGGAEERIGIFPNTGGTELSPSDFTPVAGTTFGSVNPTLIPEPATAGLLAFAGLGLLRRRRA
jgi:hypothetical protein